MPVKGWTPRSAAPPFLSVVPGACTTMDVSLPEARSQENLSCLGMIQKRFVYFLMYNLSLFHGEWMSRNEMNSRTYSVNLSVAKTKS